MKEPRYEDFDIEYTGNRFAYMGNGFTGTELNPNANPVWYFDVLQQELKDGKKAFWELTLDAPLNQLAPDAHS